MTDVYNTPLLDLVFRAASVHRMYNDPQMVRARAHCLGPLWRWFAGSSFFSVHTPAFEAAAAARSQSSQCVQQAQRMSSPHDPPASAINLHQPKQVQRCTLLSIKTGGCPENCNYCSQSSHWSEDTGLKAEKLMGLEEVYEVGGGVCVGVGGIGSAWLMVSGELNEQRSISRP